MDTLEQPHGADIGSPPVLWRGKSPQDLLRGKYSDCKISTHTKANKSLVTDVEYCEKLYVSRPYTKPDGTETWILAGTLIPIPEKT